nr:RHS repeat protein [Acinetobacter sp. Marseille-Q1620]
MVAIVSGNNLGLFNSSLNVLGKNGVTGNPDFGQTNTQNYVNIADGNLIIRQLDQAISTIGRDVQSFKTYNSKGILTANDQWSGEWSRRLALTGNLNEAGSEVKVISEDGHSIVFKYSSTNLYLSTEGDGAYDKLQIVGNTWTITDGATRQQEIYEYTPASKTGRLVGIKGTDGTNLVYGYDPQNRLISIKDASSSALNELIYIYDGTTNRIKRIDTKANGVISQNVYYEYDSLNRLSKVSTDLTPADNSISDNNVYSTSYQYDGTSTRILSVSQSDGTSAYFTYELDTVTNTYRVKTVKDNQGVTTFTYTANKTVVENSLKELWEYSYDSKQQLTSIKSPLLEVTSFNYDDKGNVLNVTHPAGDKVIYRYDGNGNLTEEYNAEGKATKYSYDAQGLLLATTKFNNLASKNATGDWVLPTGEGQTTNYIYESQRLRYVVSAEKRVLEYTYDAKGQQITRSTYQDLFIDPTVSLSTIDNWKKTKKINQLSTLEYDVFGNIKRQTDYSDINSIKDATTGNVTNQGVFTDATLLTDFVYDRYGQLLQKIVRHGANRQTTPLDPKQSIESYVYDGLGRILNITNAKGVTSYSYAAGKIIVTNAANMVTTQSFDSYGRLLSIVQSAVGQPNRSTVYNYDAAGRLIYTKSSALSGQFNFYDKNGRLSGSIDSSGLLTEFVYNKNGLITKEIRYATPLNTSGWLVNNDVIKKRIEEIRPAVNAADRVIEKGYNTSNELIWVIQPNGLKVEYAYDTAGNVTQVKTQDRIVRYFYNKDNQQIATLDASGYLVETLYNNAGQKVQVIKHSKLTTENLRASGTLAQLKPTGADNQILSDFYFYDARGQLIGSISDKGFITSYIYNEQNNTITQRKYSSAATGTITSALIWSDFLKTIPATNVFQDQTKYFDNQGRLIKQEDTSKGTTTYSYDTAGRLVLETTAANTGNDRKTYIRYNAFDEVTGTLSGEAANEIAVNMTADQINQVFNQYGIRSYYDDAGRKTHILDAAGRLTTFYYDQAGRLTHTINAEGNVAETTYSIFGEETGHTKYANNLSSTDEKVTDRSGSAIPPDFINAVGAGKRLKGGEITTSFTTLVTAIKNASKDRVEKASFDKNGQIIQVTDAEGNVLNSSYNIFGELEKEIRQQTIDGVKKQITSSYVYTKRGELKSVIRDVGGLNNTVQKEYDAFGRVTKETDARGNITTYDYAQDQGRSIQIKSANNAVSKITYDAWERKISVNENNNITSYQYDDKNRLLTIKSPEGRQIITKYNEYGDVVEVTEANGGKTLYSYNDDGVKTKETNAAGVAIAYTYDKKTGLLKESVNPLGVKTEYFYDNADRILRQVINISATEKLETRYKYDGLGQKLEVIEGSGSGKEKVTQYNYDRVGRLISVVQDPGNLKYTTTYSYDEAGQQVKIIEKGVTTLYSYDSLGRRTSEIRDATGLAIKTTYKYDQNGNITRKIDPNGNSTWYVYDNVNNLSYSINALGNVTGQVYDVNKRVIAKYEFTASQDISSWGAKDSIGLAEVTLNKANANVTRYVYDKDGNERYSIDALGYVTEKQYNNAGKATQTLDYDKPVVLTGDILSATDITTALSKVGTSSRTVSVYYDVLGRVVYSIDALGYVTRNDYDSLNNITSSYRFKNATTLSRASTTAQLDAAYKTTLPAHTKVSMLYDATGRKVFDLDQNSFLTRYSYDVVGNLIGEKQLSISSEALLDLLRTKDAQGVLGARPAATAENYDKAIKLLTDAQFKETSYFYDQLGRVAYSIDALKFVTRYSYDAFDHVSNILKFKTATTLARDVTTAQLDAVYRTPATLPENLATASLYDNLGRKVVDIDAALGVTRYSYDAFDHVINKKQLSVNRDALLDLLRTKDASGAYTSSRPAITLDNLDQAIKLVNVSQIRENNYYYDKTGRVAFEADTLGYISNYVYDAQGDLLSVKQSNATVGSLLDSLRSKDASGQYTTPQPNISLDNLDKAFKLLAVTNYRETSHVYDKAGRVNYTIDAQGYVTRYSYDAFDNVINTARFKAITALSRTSTLAQLDAVYRAATLPENILVQSVYDALNRKIKEIDAEGQSTETGYDAFGNSIWVKDKLGNKGYFYYDALNRNTMKIDPEGYVTSYAYDAYGNQLAESKYLAPALLLDKIIAADGQLNPVKILSASDAIPTTQPYIKAGVISSQIKYEYDKLNRKTKITDSVGNYEAYTYSNAFEQPATYRNKLGGIYTYSYDALGRLTQEILPEKSAGKAVINVYQYDAFGNRIKFIEAQGLAEQRISTYEYDKLNHITAKISESVAVSQYKVLDASKPNIKGLVQTTGIAKETYQYDAYGNQTLKVDANGAKTYSYYDKNGRKTDEINALGYLRHQEYNAAGQVTKLAAYETSIALPATAGGTAPIAPSGNVRIVQYEYDKLGRQTKVITPDVDVYDYDTNGIGALTRQTTVETTVYDANGNISRIVDAKGNVAFNYYDKIGRKTLSVDHEGYATQWLYTYDETTKATTQTEIKYAKRLSRNLTVADNYTEATKLLVADTNNDRKIKTTYDTLGRVVKTEVYNVKYTADGVTSQVGVATSSFTYNGLDKILTKTDSSGTVKTDYDLLGRETLRTFGEYKDSSNTLIRQRIQSTYNGLGLLSGSSILGTNDSITTDDRITQYTYDKLGRLIKETNVNLKHDIQYGYDLAGNQTWVGNDRKTADPNIIKSDQTLIEYNLLGKEVARRVSEGSRTAAQSASASVWTILEEKEMRYNAFEEITGKRQVKSDSTTKATDPWQEVIEYNNQGKVWKTNSNNGVTKYYLYDRNGNATLQLDTTGTTAITAKTPAELKSLTGVTYTETVYDKRNQVVEVRQPKISQETLDTTLNIFGQNISRTTEKSTVTLTDSANKLKFDSATQKLNIQANTQAKRLIIRYWPKGTTSSVVNTLAVDMQAGASAGGFVLDVTALKANADFSYSYSSTDASGKVLDTGTGEFKRAVNIIDVFAGGSVSATPSANTTTVATNMGTVAVDSTSGYKIPVTVNGIKQQIVNKREDWGSSHGSGVNVYYDDVISVQSIKIAIPTFIKSFGNGNFEVELSIDGQVYKQSVTAQTSDVTIALDKNSNKVLSGKSYTVKIYKRVNTSVAELLLNTTNSLPAAIPQTYVNKWRFVDDSNPPAMMMARPGAVFNVEAVSLNHEGTLNSLNQLMINNVPAGTSRVEVKYKLQGGTQWSTLASSAGLYNSNVPGWYKVNLSTLDTTKPYEYQYISYDAKGNILGGGQGTISTAINSASISQKALSAADFSGVYIDKKETVNTKQDTVQGGIVDREYLVTHSLMNSYNIASSTVPIKIRYTFDSTILKKYGSNKFVLYYEGISINRIKVLKKEFDISNSSGLINVDVELTLSELNTLTEGTSMGGIVF